MKHFPVLVAAFALFVNAPANAASDPNAPFKTTWIDAAVNLKMPSGNWTDVAMVDHFGQAVIKGQADRVVAIGPGTRWVNVTQDEVVRFVVGDRAFDWRFATHTLHSFKLAQIAPPGFLPAGTSPTIYVAPNPIYQGA